MTTTQTSDQTGTLIIKHSQGSWPTPGDDTNDQEAKAWMWACAVAWEAVHEDGPDTEVCGYVERVHDNHPQVRINTIQVANVAEETGEFAFDDATIAKVYELWDADDLLGIWHSHPRGMREPSILDWEGHPRGVPMFIVVLDLDSDGPAADDCRAEVWRYEDSDRP